MGAEDQISDAAKEAEQTETEAKPSSQPGESLTLKLLPGSGEPPTIVSVRVEDPPGPSGYRLERYVGGPQYVPEINSVVLYDKKTLLDFLRRFLGAQQAQVRCLRQRLPVLRELLGASQTDNEIEVDLSTGG